MQTASKERCLGQTPLEIWKLPYPVYLARHEQEITFDDEAHTQDVHC